MDEDDESNRLLTNFQCKRCGKGFMTEIELGKHIRNHIIPPGSGRKGRLPKKDKPSQNTPKKTPDVSDESDSKENDKDFTPKPYQMIKEEMPDSGRLRVLPRRSLKGKRTTGFLVDNEFLLTKNQIKKEPEGEEEEAIEDTPVSKVIQKKEEQSPIIKRKRGRPKGSTKAVEIVTPKRQKIFENEKPENENLSKSTETENIVSKTEDSSQSTEIEQTVNQEDIVANKTFTESAETETFLPENSDVITTYSNESSNVDVVENISNNNESGAKISLEVYEKHESVPDEDREEGQEENSMILESNPDQLGLDSESIPESNNSINSANEISQNSETMDADDGQTESNINKKNKLEQKGDEENINPNEDLEDKQAKSSDAEERDEDSEDTNDDKPKRKRKKKGLPIPMEIRDTPNGKEYVCKVCNKKFHTERYLRLHAPMHTSEFKCSTCDKAFARKESLQKHECRITAKIIEVSVPDQNDSESLQLNDESKLFRCSNCNEKFQYLFDAEEHLKTHRKGYECEHCGKVFLKKLLLNQHICSKQKMYPCDICSQTFPNEKSLFRHVAMHTDIYKCETCEKCFSRKDSLIRHVTKCCPDKAEKYGVFSCKKCSKTFGTKLGLENHEVNCKLLPCDACHQVFDKQKHLDDHDCKPLPRSDEPRAKHIKFSCSDCNKSFKNLHYLLQHKAVHCNSHECFSCGKKMKSQEERDDHERFCLAVNKIRQDGKINCDLCEAEFFLAKEYKEHYQTHTHLYHCEKCDKRFIKIGSLHTHQCITDLIKCQLCERQCKSVKIFHNHMASHSDVVTRCSKCDKYFENGAIDNHDCDNSDEQGDVSSIKYVCHYCGKNFVSSSNLNKHIKVHGDKDVECPICFKKFHYPEYLKVHIAGVHEKKTPYQCSDCGKILTSKPGLISHMKLFHSETKDVYPCPECGKCFSQKGNMKTHMFSHAKERTFQCTFCPKAFKYPDQLNRHKLSHTMDNLYQCDICEKKFVKDYELKKHIQANHSNKMYVCEFCGSRCGHKHTLQRHYRRKHPASAHLVENPDYVDALFQEVDIDSLVMQKGEMVVMEHTAQVQQPNGITVTVPVEEMVSQSAAEALSSLSVAGNSQGIISNEVEVAQLISQDGTIVQIPGQENMYTVQTSQEDGTEEQQTVVILQIINPQEQQIEVTELETQVVNTEEIETISQDDVPDFQYTENILSS